MARVKVPAAEAEIAAGKIQCLLMNGSFIEAREVVNEIQQRYKKPQNPFIGYAKLNDVPLSMGEIETEILGSLEEHGIRTYGHLLKASDRNLLAIPGIGEKRLSSIRDAAESMASSYIRWMIGV